MLHIYVARNGCAPQYRCMQHLLQHYAQMNLILKPDDSKIISPENHKII